MVFQASATIWYDSQANRLRMKARQAAGDSVDAEIEVRPDTLIWSLPVQGGRIRFTIAHSATDWHEVAHFIRDGAPPIPAMNALAEDQLGRLRSLLAGTGIPFGMYVGKTPERESEVAGIRLPAGASRAGSSGVASSPR